MSDMIPATLIPAGVNDQRSRDFIASLSAILEDFQPASLLVQDPMTVDARLLPIMTVELAMSDFMTPGLREDVVRKLLSNAPAIHAMTGTIAGSRRALGALGVTLDWVQWWQKEPKGPHDTHTVTAYAADEIMETESVFLDAAAQVAIFRVFRATQRWSQEVDFRIGLGAAGRLVFAGVASVAAPLVVRGVALTEVEVSQSFRITGALSLAASLTVSTTSH